VKVAARRDEADAKWRAESDAKDRQRKLADAVRLAADAVVKAAENYSDTFDPMHGALTEAHNELLEAVLAHRKAKEEASRG
jgi:hypothetical protein